MFDAPGFTGKLSDFGGNKCVQSMTKCIGIVWNIHTDMEWVNMLRDAHLAQKQTKYVKYATTAKVRAL